MVRGICFVSALVAALALAAPASATFPGKNGKIVFVRDGDLWTINPDGSALTQITSGPALDSQPSWSPDGNLIAFERRTLGVGEPGTVGYDGFDIYVRSADGTLTEVGTYPADDYAPAWSPDGTKLAFPSERDARIYFDGSEYVALLNLVVSNADGSGGTVVISNSVLLWPDWSPRGDRIAYVLPSTDGPTVYTINTDGTDAYPVTRPPGYGSFDTDPSWSPDGGRLALLRNRVEPEEWTGLVTIAPNGGDEQRLTTGGSDPVWSPDGAKIAFARYDGIARTYQIAVVPSGGGEAEPVPSTDGALPVAPDPFVFDHDWQPLVAPRNVAPPALAGRPHTGSVLAASRGRWFGTGELSFEYTWRRCDRTGLACETIAGARGPNYTVSPADVVRTLRAAVTVTSDLGTASATSTTTNLIGVHLVGTSASDVLRGTAGYDLVDGRRGGDTIRGLGGDDRLYGGRGRDVVYGGPGADILVGGRGDDVLRGRRDGTRDQINCGGGRDVAIADRVDSVARSCETVRRG